MSDSLPWSLLFAWFIFSGFANSQLRLTQVFKGSSKGFLTILSISAIASTITGIALLIFYFTQVSWYWPLVLFFVASVLGAIPFAFFEVKAGLVWVSMASFVIWPAAAVWAALIINRLAV